MDKYYMPRFLDQPYKMVFFTIDEAIILLFSVIGGLYIGKLIAGILLASGLIFIIKKLKGKEGHYFIYHLAYWYLPEIIKLRSTPPSYLREILG
jgi:conjugal transfer pilus assembly protein TraL